MSLRISRVSAAAWLATLFVMLAGFFGYNIGKDIAFNENRAQIEIEGKI